MKKLLFTLGFAAFALLSGCSSRTMYDSMRYNQQLRCQELQGRDRDECLKRSEMSYDEYQRQLKERDADR